MNLINLRTKDYIKHFPLGEETKSQQQEVGWAHSSDAQSQRCTSSPSQEKQASTHYEVG